MAEPDVAAPAPVTAPAPAWDSLPAALLGPLEKRHWGELRHYQWRWVWPPSFRGTSPWRRLRRDIEGHDIRDPLIILADGQVIDGGHRLDLAKEFGLIVPVRVVQLPLPLSDTDRLRVETFAVLQAAARRQLAPHEVTAMLLHLARGRAELAHRQASLANLRRGPQPGGGPRPGPTVAALAAKAGVSPRSLERAVRLVRHGSPELQAQVRTGTLSLRKADWSLRPSAPPPRPTDTSTALAAACAAYLSRVDRAVAAAATWPPDGRTALSGVLDTMLHDLDDLMTLIAQQTAADGANTG